MACIPAARLGSSSGVKKQAELGVTTQPYVVIVGGGQGGIALGARLAAAERADDHRREE